MTPLCKPPMAAEGSENAAAVQSDTKGTEGATSLESNMGDVQFTKSRPSTCDTCPDGVHEELMLVMHQKLQRREVGPKEGTKREQQDLVRQLCEAKAQILAKSKEVCELQVQLAQELSKRQKLYSKFVEREREILGLLEQQKLYSKFMGREREILRFLESPVGSKARVSDIGQNCDMSKTAVVSPSSLKAGSSNVADGVRLLLACNPQPMTAPQAMIFSPQITHRVVRQPKEQSPQNNFCWKVATPLSSPMLTNRSVRAPLGRQFKFHVCEKSASIAITPRQSPRTGAMAEHAVTGVNQVIRKL